MILLLLLARFPMRSILYWIRDYQIPNHGPQNNLLRYCKPPIYFLIQSVAPAFPAKGLTERASDIFLILLDLKSWLSELKHLSSITARPFFASQFLRKPM